MRTLSGHTGRVLWVSWSPDGTRLASSAEDRTAIIWDTKTGKLLLTLRHDHPGTASYIYTVAWSPDSRLVATAVHYHDPAIWIWEAESGKLVTTISLPRLPDGGEVTAYRLAWSPDGSQIASSFSGGKFRIWDPKTGKLIGAPQIYFASGQLVRWSPDNRRLVAPGGDSQLGFTIEILNVETDEIIQFPSGHRYRLNSVDWSPDGRRIASNSDALDGAIKIWNAETEELLLTIEETGDVPALRFSPDATRIAYGIWDGFSGEIKIRDRETSDILQIIPTRVLSSIRWLPADGTKLASIGWIPEDGSSRGIIEIHEAETGDLVGTILEDRNIFFTSLDWSPDGTRFATGLSRGLDSWIKIWEVETGKLLSTLTDKRLGQVHSVVWSPDGQYIASATGSVVRVWDAEHGQLLRTFTGHNRDVVAVDWSSDGSRIASAAWDGSIRIWGERPKDASNSPKSAANSLSANNKLSPDSIEPSFEPLGFKSDRQNLSFSASNQSRIQGGAATRKSWLKNLFNLITFKSRRRY